MELNLPQNLAYDGSEKPEWLDDETRRVVRFHDFLLYRIGEATLQNLLVH
ncbi:MAG: hypothetical protein N2Z23_09880 [Pyrinomonadaceae bacterium]|nr:hypothetical protein [Pyrinomonadaceae bacterium]MCX7640732.1 hypothetical protein [Pyrinomonadaceae bacterium]